MIRNIKNIILNIRMMSSPLLYYLKWILSIRFMLSLYKMFSFLCRKNDFILCFNVVVRPELLGLQCFCPLFIIFEDHFIHGKCSRNLISIPRKQAKLQNLSWKLSRIVENFEKLFNFVDRLLLLL